MAEPDSRLRFRLWIDGKLAGDDWIDCADADAREQVVALQERHLAEAARAEQSGSVWLIEAHDPERPGEAAFMRFGTDKAGMIMPSPLAPEPGRNHPGRDSGASGSSLPGSGQA